MQDRLSKRARARSLKRDRVRRFAEQDCIRRRSPGGDRCGEGGAGLLRGVAEPRMSQLGRPGDAADPMRHGARFVEADASAREVCNAEGGGKREGMGGDSCDAAQIL